MKKAAVLFLLLFLLSTVTVEARREHQEGKQLIPKTENHAPTSAPENQPTTTPAPTKPPSFWGIISNDSAVRAFLDEPVDDLTATPSATPTKKPIPTGVVKRASTSKNIPLEILGLGVIIAVVIFLSRKVN